MKKIIITGANGFIGSSLVKNLIDKGIDIIAIDISFVNSTIKPNGHILKIEDSLDDVESLSKKLAGYEYEALYHFAWKGVNGIEKANPYVQLQNIKTAILCADLCRILGIKRMCCAGTVTEQSIHSLPNISKTNGSMIYGVAKHATHLILESYCKNIGVNFVWMQFSNIYGVGNRTGNLINYTLTNILNGNQATFGPADQPYDFIYIDDLLEAISRIGLAKELHDSFYYIGSGSPKILKEYLLTIGRITKCTHNILIGAREDDGIKYSFDMFDINPLIKDIGEYVETDFEEGINKTINWMQTI